MSKESNSAVLQYVVQNVILIVLIIHRINHIGYSVERYGQGFIRWSFVLQ